MIKVTHVFADGSRADSLYGRKVEVTKENEKIYRSIAKILKAVEDNEPQQS